MNNPDSRLAPSSALTRKIAGVAAFVFFSVIVSAQTAINLTQDAGVRSVGTYTYYSRATTPFTKVFYPSGSLHGSVAYDNNRIDTGNNATAISFTTGYLTDNLTSTKVNGWAGVMDANKAIDLVFDLGDVYTLTSLTITYTDTSGARWLTGVDIQQAFTSSTAPLSDSDLTLFDTSTATGSTSNGLMSFAGTAIDARYVVFRLTVNGGAVGSGSYGGYINDVAIYGTPVSSIPEPSTYAIMTGLSVLAFGMFRRSHSV